MQFDRQLHGPPPPPRGPFDTCQSWTQGWNGGGGGRLVVKWEDWVRNPLALRLCSVSGAAFTVQKKKRQSYYGPVTMATARRPTHVLAEVFCFSGGSDSKKEVKVRKQTGRADTSTRSAALLENLSQCKYEWTASHHSRHQMPVVHCERPPLVLLALGGSGANELRSLLQLL